MNFISLKYVLFLPLVILAYYLIPMRLRWLLLLVASYYFYMCWKAEYIVLILISTLVDYFVALKMQVTEDKAARKFLLLISLVVNLGLLFFFKYFDFINDSLRDFLNYFNIFYESKSFGFLLPVGISFYTFQTLAYTIDVYKGRKEAEKHLGYFALYVAYFPQLVAGPIERASHLLGQFYQENKFKLVNIGAGLRQILWGVLKKVVIADHLAIYINASYGNIPEHNAVNLLLATLFFGFQIYCDFSGYSDIAIGSARLMNIDLMKNFNSPYFAASISEFWQRWHISLSTWFRDYVYFPLGGNKVKIYRHYINLFAVFLVSGLWHGANWTFVIWGLLHACYYSSEKLLFKNFVLPKFVKIFLCYLAVNFAWIFFRAASIHDAWAVIHKLFDFSAYDLSTAQLSLELFDLNFAIASVLILLFIEALHNRYNLVASFCKLPWLARLLVYTISILIVLVFWKTDAQEFIYFQF